ALATYLRNRPLGRLFVAPFDVVLSDLDVVEPDLVYIAKEHDARVTDQNVRGTPDLVAEILSLGTRRTDEVVKRKLYERFGVAEYLGRGSGTRRHQDLPSGWWRLRAHRGTQRRTGGHAEHAAVAGILRHARPDLRGDPVTRDVAGAACDRRAYKYSEQSSAQRARLPHD